MTRPAQVLVGVLALVALTAGAYAVGSATSYDDPPPTREIVVDEVASDPSPSTSPSRRSSGAPSAGPSRPPRERADDRRDDRGGVEVVTPRPQQLDGDDDGPDDDGPDDDDDDDGDDDGDDDD
ncbi:hypothetical protein [Nocardioides marmoraquaticus]